MSNGMKYDVFCMMQSFQLVLDVAPHHTTYLIPYTHPEGSTNV